MGYNMSFTDNGANFGSLVGGLNTITDGYLASLLLLILFILFMAMFKNYDTKVGLTASSALITLIAIFFWAVNIIPFYVIFVPIALLFAGLIWGGLSD